MSTELGAAVAEAGARERARAARAVARAEALGIRIAEARHRQEELLQHAATLRHVCRVQRARRQRRGPAAESVGRFAVQGLVDGYEVAASWSDGRLTCDERLRSRALLLVDLEEEFLYDDPPRCFIATLDGPPIAVALTLIRACDRVTRIMLAPPEAA